MQTEQLEFDSIEQQQAIFGTQDQFVRLIEKALSVNIGLRDSKVEIQGESERSVKCGADVLCSLLRLHGRGEAINSDVIYRLIEEAAAGDLDETFQAMGDAVALTQRGKPIRCKTIGQRNYVKALRDNVVTLCIGPAGTG